MSFFDWCTEVFDTVVDKATSFFDWLTDRFDGISGFFDGLLGDANGAAIGLTVLFTGFLAFSLLTDPFHTGMNTLPLIPRIITPILFIPICYFICVHILDK